MTGMWRPAVTQAAQLTERSRYQRVPKDLVANLEYRRDLVGLCAGDRRQRDPSDGTRTVVQRRDRSCSTGGRAALAGAHLGKVARRPRIGGRATDCTGLNPAWDLSRSGKER